MQHVRKKDILFVSLLLFSMFFGAGNLIFPPLLGQEAGQHVWLALAGFIFSAVGLPLLGVAAVAKAGSFDALNRRVHPIFALLFPVTLYLCIGLLGVPRASSLAFEMGLKPFLPAGEEANRLWLWLYTLAFFGVVVFFCLTPSKLVDRVGKWLTPLLLILIAVIFVKRILTGMEDFSAPTDAYKSFPLLRGFLDGYQTGDALAALIYGIVIATALRAKGVENNNQLTKGMVYAGFGAGVLLTAVYLILGFLGASGSAFGKAENGAQILSMLTGQLFGATGTLLLGLVFTLACLCVSIGITTSCSQYAAKLVPQVSYKVWLVSLCLVNLTIANLGLTQILKVSGMILGMIYPVAIVLILLGLLVRAREDKHPVYVMTVSLVAVFSLGDLLVQTLSLEAGRQMIASLPFYAQGFGWLLPALVGGVLGYARVWRLERVVEKRTVA
jgi:LIVCS family branched-chain amino acid:cation transporter